jgi:hypothetical protein
MVPQLIVERVVLNVLRDLNGYARRVVPRLVYGANHSRAVTNSGFVQCIMILPLHSGFLCSGNRIPGQGEREYG